MVFVISRIVLFAILLLVIVLILLLLDRYMRSRRAAFAGGEVPAGMRRIPHVGLAPWNVNCTCDCHGDPAMACDVPSCVDVVID